MRTNIEYICPFCCMRASRDYVIQGRGKQRNKQYFHRSCFELSVKQGTYWDFKIR